MTKMTASKARETFADVVNRAAYKGERIVLERHGKVIAAIVPAEDVATLEALEDRLDLAAARKALKEAEKKGTIPYETIRKELGLA